MEAFAQNLFFALPEMAKDLNSGYVSVVCFADIIYMFYLMSDGKNFKYIIQQFLTSTESGLEEFFCTYRNLIRKSCSDA